jgi:hypothetical protein
MCAARGEFGAARKIKGLGVGIRALLGIEVSDWEAPSTNPSG